MRPNWLCREQAPIFLCPPSERREMSRDSVLICLITIVGFGGAAAAALTRFGSPIEGAATDPELYKLIAEGSPGHGVTPITVPAPISALGIAPVPDTARSRDSEPRDTSTRIDPVTAWRAVAVNKDSIAVRQCRSKKSDGACG